MNTKGMKFLMGSAVAFTIAAGMVSCSMEEPFKNNAEGSLILTADIRGNVVKTRAMDADELSLLRQKCVVYIENDKGVIRKYKGLDNIPDEITLRTGSYVCEGWSGDSVSASFSSKFYRGYQRFDMAEGVNSLTLKCNIANVLVSVDPASLNVNLKDLKITFWHSRGELVFDASNIADAKGYFMMPNADKNLQYKVEGTKISGESYVKEGVIENVERAHEYVMTLTENAPSVSEGGALIRLTIADIPVIEEEVEIFMPPTVSGVGLDIEKQLVSLDRNFIDAQLHVRGYFGLSSVIMNLSSNFSDIQSGMNLTEGSVQADLLAKGIRVERRISRDAATSLESGEVEVDELYITFSKAFLDALPESDTEYVVTFDATDGRHRSATGQFRIANSAGAVEHLAPVGMPEAPDAAKEPMAVLATSATLTGYVYDAENAANYGIKYREVGEADWQVAYPASNAKARPTRASVSTFQVIVSGLKPATTYEYRVFCDGFESETVNTFTTESYFTIPNSSMESWSSYVAGTLFGDKNVTLPWSVGDKVASFWGSGNEGSATANLTLTDKTTDMIHSGTYAARLESKSAMGVIAAGNIFIGHYVKTDGTNGVLSLGREYNGSHPAKLSVWANYRPGTSVKIKSGNESFCPDLADTDQAQIYIALTTEPVEIRTNPSNRKLFNVDDDVVLAYGEKTFKESFGPDGQLQNIEIPISYKANARTNVPKYLIVVVSASKYGDYFCGSAGSVMYLDDFKLVYE